MKPLSSKRRISIAVYWFGENEYGGMTDCKTFAEAEAEAARTRLLGYEKPSVSEVRIVVRSTKVYRAALAQQEEA